ncbi:MAG TPA: enoyl-CoA hydratase/isomerase family protein [Myxococcales bacterium]|jgi:enoyl-CoA hydratase
MPDVSFERRGGLGVMTLDRPKALNAVTLEMYRAMQPRLDEWRDDQSVRALVLRGNGRAFCAGGDVRRIHQERATPLRPGDYKYDMFYEEYLFIRDLHRFPRPQVALVHGVTMGGGMGLSVNGRFRVATETSVFAMPEVFIGSLPDVAATRFLNFCPGEIGTYLALTGARVGPADALYCRFATHVVAEGRLGELFDGLAALPLRDAEHEIDELLQRFAIDAGEPKLLALQPAIDRCFSKATVEEIVAALEAENAPWAREALLALRKAAPLSLKCTLRAVRDGKGATVEEALRLEFRVIQHLIADDADFYEGVRAVLVDKDRTARWRFQSLHEVSDAEVDRHFASLGDGELRFP